MSAIRNSLLIAALCVATPALAQSTFSGRVVSLGSGLPVRDATLELTSSPGGGEARVEIITNPLGGFKGEIPAGEWSLRVLHFAHLPLERTITIGGAGLTHERYELIPLEAPPPPGFELSLQAFDVRTAVPLPEAEFLVERWPTSDASGPPAFSRMYLGSPEGMARALDMEPGWYRITVSRYAWKTLVHPSTGTLRLDASHAAVAGLEPQVRTLRIQARAPAPGAPVGSPLQPLRGVAIDVEGLDFEEDRVIVPARSVITDHEGNAWVPDLGAIRWKVTSRALGYEPAEQVWDCSRTAWENAGCDTFTIGVGPGGSTNWRGWLAELRPVFHEATRLTVQVETPYLHPVLSESVILTLEGLEGTTTAGYARMLNALDRGEGPQATFEHLLPGRYLLTASTLFPVHWSNLGLDPGTLRPPGTGQFQIALPPREIIVEVGDEEHAIEILELDPLPAVIEGRLLVAEDATTDGTRASLYHPRAGVEIEFALHHSAQQILPPELSTARATTDANGNFRVEVLPGPWGIRIPSMPGYDGIQVIGGPANAAAQTHGWPYPDPWPWPAVDRSTAIPWLMIEGGVENRFDLRLHRSGVGVWGFASVSDPVGEVYLTPTLRAQKPAIVGAADSIRLTGPLPRTAALDSDLVFELGWLPPGDYVLSGDHPLYEFTTTSGGAALPFTIPEWSAHPGAVPTRDPFVPRLVAPGSFVHLVQILPVYDELRAERRTVPTPRFRVMRWLDVEHDPPARYIDGGSIIVEAFESPHEPGVLRPIPRFTSVVPAAPCTLWVTSETVDGTLRGSIPCVETGEPEVFVEGPSSQLSRQSLPIAPDYLLELEGRLPDGSPIAGVSLLLDSFDPSSVAVTGTTLPTRFLPGASTKAEDVAWTIRGVDCSLRGGSGGFSYACEVLLDRQIVVAGTLRDDEGQPLPGVEIKVYGRHGDLVGTGLTSAEGTFRFAGGSTNKVRPLWVEARAPGFAPLRRRFEVTSAQPSLEGLELSLALLPPPQIDDYTLDRFGHFLVGVRKSTDDKGFDSDNAKAALTATWTVEATDREIQYELDAFDPEGTGPAKETVRLFDEIAEVWLVDRRVYSDRAGVDPVLREELGPEDLIDPLTWRATLLAAEHREEGGTPYLLLTERGANRLGDGPGVYRGRVSLPALAPGLFDPLVVVVTRHGAVAVAEYELPEGKRPLIGLTLPPWAEVMSNVIGAVGAKSASFDVSSYVPAGKFRPLPEFTATIGEQGGYLRYIYGVGVIWQEGTKAPAGGFLSMGSGLMGLSLKGGVTFTLDGMEEFVSLSGAASTTKSFALEQGLHKPTVLEGSSWKPQPKALVKMAKEPEVSGGGALEIRERLDQKAMGQLLLRTTSEAFIDAEVAFSGTAFLSKNPYIGPVMLVMQSLGLDIEARIPFGAGGRVVETWTTVLPVATSSISSELRRGHFLGTIEETIMTGNSLPGGGTERTFLWKSGIGLALTSGAGSVAGHLQLGAPTHKPGPGVAITVNELGTWPPLKRVEGAFSGVIRVMLGSSGLSVSRAFQWDLLPFDWQPNTEPYFHLAPMPGDWLVLTPSEVTPSSLGGGPGVLVSNLYPAGDHAVASQGTSGLLAWTQTAPDGRMSVLASIGGPGFERQEVAAQTEGIVVSVAAATLGDGRHLVVWSELEARALGDPLAPSVVRAAVRHPAGEWEAPFDVAASNEIATGLLLAPTASGAVLVWGETDEGTMSRRRSLHAAAFDGADWSSAEWIRSAAPVRSLALAADQGVEGVAELAVVDERGELETWSQAVGGWVDERWQGEDRSASGLAFDEDGKRWLVIGEASSLSLATRTPGGEWSDAALLAEPASASEIRVLPGPDFVFIAWLEAEHQGRLRYLWLDPDGAVVEGPVVSEPASGTFSELDLVLGSDDDTVRVILRRDDASSSRVEEIEVVRGEEPTIPGGSGGAGGGEGGSGVGGAGGGEGGAGVGGSGGGSPGGSGGTPDGSGGTGPEGEGGAEGRDPARDDAPGCGCGADSDGGLLLGGLLTLLFVLCPPSRSSRRLRSEAQ